MIILFRLASLKLSLFLLAFFVLVPFQGAAQVEMPEDPLSLLCFGDSITYGVGDGTQPGDFIEKSPEGGDAFGYPARLREILQIPVVNAGKPGEQFVSQGNTRFPNAVSQSSAEIIVVLEGYNDAIFQVSSAAYERRLQRVVNVARALGKELILVTLSETCCSRNSLNPFLETYSNKVREVALVNDVGLADLETYWRSLCPERSSCDLLNKPEGLHPNTLGYDVIAEVIAAAVQQRAPDFSGGGEPPPSDQGI